MATNRRTMPLSAQALWEVLSDGFAYREWVVGTRDVRAVEEGFPAPGVSLHYSVGRHPFSHEGHTTVVAAEPGRRLQLEVDAWPAAAVHVAIELRPRGAERTEVTITEHPSKGVAALLHNPLTDLLLRVRNIETLRRLEIAAMRRRG